MNNLTMENNMTYKEKIKKYIGVVDEFSFTKNGVKDFHFKKLQQQQKLELYDICNSKKYQNMSEEDKSNDVMKRISILDSNYNINAFNKHKVAQ